jgi:hypothetical protein
MNLSIVYWNTAGKPELTALALNDRNEYDVIAIQEPWVNEELKTVHCPSQGRYRAVYGSGRAALYVHKRHAIEAWEQQSGEDGCYVRFGGGDRTLTLYSIYSPIRRGRQWYSPIHDHMGRRGLYTPVRIKREVDSAEITEILRQTAAWKAPGTDDLLPTWFLKACGPPLAEILARLANASFSL